MVWLPFAGLLGVSGAAALLLESLWVRRLSLAFGSTGVALTLTLGVYMAGLGLGGAWAGRRAWARPARAYGGLELLAAGWAVGVPWVVRLAEGVPGGLLGQLGAAALVLLPPAFLAGATLPVLARAPGLTGREVGALYGANTAGAVLGALAAPTLLLPILGVRGAELLGAAALAAVGGVALTLRLPALPAAPRRPPAALRLAAPVVVAGGAAMALEVVWTRLAGQLLGGSAWSLALVLAVYLAGVALGAALGRRWGAAAVGPGLLVLGLGALVGAGLWGVLPHGLGLLWRLGGEVGVRLGGAALLALGMGLAPVASGVVFSAALAEVEAGEVLAANTAGGVAGALLAGLWGLPILGLRGLVVLIALGCGATALLVLPRRLPALGGLIALGLLAWMLPAWDARLYAVGLYHKLDRFADLSPRAIDRYAHEGWQLLSYADGVTATVAVGEGRVRWLSINGKVDASTGDDMPTQLTSGQLPVTIARSPGAAVDALVVGLASGVTAGAALQAGARAVTVVEIEPEVVRAAAAFAPQNGGVLDDPRARIVVGDARAWLRTSPERYGVIISEPSNPWITGVSNLFTAEYWALARARLAEGGVFCQWMQLYALPPAAFRGLIRTFLTVFPQAWLFETIPGADALLVAAPALPPDLPWTPSLDPAGLQRLAGRARLNTDDDPWVEFEAPRWLYRATGPLNAQLIAEAAGSAPPTPDPEQQR